MSDRAGSASFLTHYYSFESSENKYKFNIKTVAFSSVPTVLISGPWTFVKTTTPTNFWKYILSNIPDKNSRIGRKFYYLEKLNSKYYLEKFNSKNGRKFYYSQKLCFDRIFA